MLKIENLYLEIGKFKLGSINLTLGKEEYFVILGETGSGKTLFLESIAGKYHKLAGKIFLNNYKSSCVKNFHKMLFCDILNLK